MPGASPPGSGPPEVISHYRLVELCGSGGMGSVYRAIDRRDDSTVAIKLLHAHLETDEMYRERFEREAHVAALLRSPYTVHLLDYGFDGGRYFLVMQYVEGESVKDALRSGPLELRRALRIGAQVARALEEAEARGVIHRDIKPDNILLGPGELAKVSDFGIARQVGSGTLTMPGAFLGTLAYAAPELALGKVDHRSDIYSLGATIYHMLTGRPPYRGDPLEVLRHHAETPLSLEPLAGMPQDVVELVKRCMEKDPAQRYQSASALAGALEHLARSVPAPEAEAPTEVSDEAPTEVKASATPELEAATEVLEKEAVADTELSAPEVEAATRVPETAAPEKTQMPPTEVKRPKRRPPRGAPLVALELGPPRPGGLFGARLSPTLYALTLRNNGDEPLTLHLEAQDGEGRCACSLPHSVSLSPHEAKKVALKVAPRQRRWRGDRETVAFVVSASPGGGNPAATVSGQFEDVPYGWLPYAGGGIVAGALAGVFLTIMIGLAGGEDGAGPSGTIAFGSARQGNDEIHLMNADGSGVTRLTVDSASDLDPTWSPDGRRIAFVSDRDGDPEIYIMNKDGTGVLKLTDDDDGESGPAWSPNGRQLAFASDRDGDLNVYLLSVEDLGVTQLTSEPGVDRHPAWSADGLRIAFESDRDGNFNIYVMNADGSGVARLTDDPADDTAPAWSPDGERIAFVSDRDGDSEIYTMNQDGSGVTKLTDNSYGDFEPAWSPDGQYLAFESDRDGNREIYVMGSDGSNPTRLTDSPTDDHKPAWSSAVLGVSGSPEAGTPTPTLTPTAATPTTAATATAVPTPTAAATATAVSTPTAAPTPTPVPTPTAAPTPTPVPPSDRDKDTVPDASDNCPDIYNPDQANTYGDSRGDACESRPVSDRDKDTVPDESDNCPDSYNPDQANTYGDGRGDACEPLPDRDYDTVPDAYDNCPDIYNPDQADTYGDSRGDACEPLPGPPPLSFETGPWVFDWVAVSNTCDFGPLVGDTEREILYFQEAVSDDGYISDGELASVYSEDGTYLADAVLVWPDLYLDYSPDWDWMISYYIEFYGTNEYLTADKIEFFSDVICDISWQG